jgi:hypothetical protein
MYQSWPIGHTSGFDTTDVGLKYEAFRNNEHEALVSVGVSWGIGQSGAQSVGADEPNTVQPAVFFGKGFGDLPDWLSWARPFAVTGAIVDTLPIGPTGKALAPNLATGSFDTIARFPSPNTALGLFTSIQHLLSHQPVHGRPSEGGAAQSVRAACRVQFRQSARANNRGDH